jgi:hypothetical protein
MLMLRAVMKPTMRTRAAAMAACALAACALAWGGDAYAQAQPELARVLDLIAQQEQRLDAQERQLHEQQRQLGEQRALIERQRRELEAMGGVVSEAALGEVRGAGAPASGLAFTTLDPDMPIAVNRRNPYHSLLQADGGGGGGVQSSAPAETPSAAAQAPVGQAPPEQRRAEVDALPEGATALSARGKLTIEPSIEYSRSSSNRLVFRGVEIVSGVQIGLIEANDTARDTLAASFAARYALTDRFEIEGRAPFIYRSDRVTTLAQNEDTVTRTFELDGANLGDVEMSARYQLNRGERGAPIFVAGARIKSDTGLGPFELNRDEAGIATELATGSGFWGVQGSVSMLYPTDPVVLFANASYLYNIKRDINRDIGEVHVGEVDPGDSIGLGFGFGFALNPRFSYSLGYSHSYVLPTESRLNDTTQRSTELQVGALQLGMSFRATERTTISANVDVGVTEDSPDVRVAFRTPIRF